MHEAERESDDPAPRNVVSELSQRRVDDVFERHVNDGDRDQCFDERREPEHVRDKPEGRGDQRNRMPDRERSDDDDERPQPPERDHQAAQEQQVVGAFENVPEAGLDKAQRGLVPTGIEAHETGIALELERARGAEAHAVETFWPSRSTRRRIANSERSDWIGYSSRTSSNCWFQ